MTLDASPPRSAAPSGTRLCRVAVTLLAGLATACVAAGGPAGTRSSHISKGRAAVATVAPAHGERVEAAPPSPVAPIRPVPSALLRRVLQLIERVERESHCRFHVHAMLAPPAAAPRHPHTTLLIGYRGPEVDCRAALDRLNARGAGEGLGFAAARLSLAQARDEAHTRRGKRAAAPGHAPADGGTTRWRPAPLPPPAPTPPPPGA